jgi:2,3-bisphosphoglycerate-dependent phosphoglycerate mutase
MYKIVLMRHGESVWNKENRFTGWVDVDLTAQGESEAHKAGRLLLQSGFTFDVAFTSFLKRASKTLDIVLSEMNISNIPIQRSWRLNERHYGALQGLNKSETAVKYGEEQVKKWRRGYDVDIPKIDKNSHMYPGNDPLYKDLKESEIPLSENLKDVVNRVLPYWQDYIVPAVKGGKKVIVSASGNTLRAIVKYLDNLSEADIVEFNVPTAIPMVYELDNDLKPIKRYFLGDQESIKKAQEKVANQGKK